MTTEAPSFSGHRYRAMLSRVGPCAPIEERIGRRLVRLVPPDTEDGMRLLQSGRVAFVGPEGEELGPILLEEALARLRERLEARLESASAEAERDAIRDGLDALDRWKGRCRDA